MLEYNMTLTESQPVLQLQKRKMFNKKKKFKHKKKFNGKTNHDQGSSTYDSKLHHRSKGSSGYGLKRGVEQDPAELHGSSLRGMLDKWKTKD